MADGRIVSKDQRTIKKPANAVYFSSGVSGRLRNAREGADSAIDINIGGRSECVQEKGRQHVGPF
jgi:hypothetical protein